MPPSCLIKFWVIISRSFNILNGLFLGWFTSNPNGYIFSGKYLLL